MTKYVLAVACAVVLAPSAYADGPRGKIEPRGKVQPRGEIHVRGDVQPRVNECAEYNAQVRTAFENAVVHELAPASGASVADPEMSVDGLYACAVETPPLNEEGVKALTIVVSNAEMREISREDMVAGQRAYYERVARDRTVRELHPSWTQWVMARTSMLIATGAIVNPASAKSTFAGFAFTIVGTELGLGALVAPADDAGVRAFFSCTAAVVDLTGILASLPMAAPAALVFTAGLAMDAHACYSSLSQWFRERIAEEQAWIREERERARQERVNPFPNIGDRPPFTGRDRAAEPAARPDAPPPHNPAPDPPGRDYDLPPERPPPPERPAPPSIPNDRPVLG